MKRAECYRRLWDDIARMNPEAILLRAPAGIDSFYPSAGGDLDILARGKIHDRIAACLLEAGFHCPVSGGRQSFRSTFFLRSLEDSEPYVVDLYRKQQWGWGVFVRGEGLVDETMETSLRFLFDGKRSRDVVERPDRIFALHRSPWIRRLLVGAFRRLWDRGWYDTIAFLLVCTRTIGVDFSSVFGTWWLALTYRFSQVRTKRGVEVAFVGVDGSGKSTSVDRLHKLPAPIRSIYMGTNRYQTALMRAVDRSTRWRKLAFFVFHFEQACRLLKGYLHAKRGYIVLYDRHVAEIYRLDRGVKARVSNFFLWMYRRDPDLTFLLSGDIATLHARKQECSIEVLEVMNRDLQVKLRHLGITYDTIETSALPSEEVYRLVGRRILELYAGRLRS